MSRMFKLVLTISVLAVMGYPSTALASGACQPVGEEFAPALDTFYLQLPAGPPEGDLEAVYLVNGARFFAEQLAFQGRTLDGGQGVELLAWHPEQRDQIRALLDRGVDVEVQIRLDSAALEPQALGQLRVDQGMSPSAAIQPLQHLSTGSEQTPPSRVDGVPGDMNPMHPQSIWASSTTCEDDCWWERENCEDGCAGDQYCIDFCQSRYDDCIYVCNNPWECPEVTEWTDVERLFVRDTGQDVCAGDWAAPYGTQRVLYDLIVIKYKFTSYRKTTYCDYTTVTEVTAITYSPEEYCYRYFTDPCYWGTYSTPVCIYI